MLSASFFGTVIDKNSKKPIPHAIISDADFSVISDKNGTFNIKTSQDTVNIKSYGYRSLKLTKDLNTTVFELTPIKVKALYLSFWRANLSSKNIKNILKIVKNKEVNSIIVDVKNEYGSTSYKTSFQQANSYGAWHKRTIKDIKKFIELMHSHNIYLIARIVTFKDELQASNNPEYAIKKADGEIWRNHDEMGWVDPFDKRAHNYSISIFLESKSKLKKY
jgi:hypothetical protein